MIVRSYLSLWKFANRILQLLQFLKFMLTSGVSGWNTRCSRLQRWYAEHLPTLTKRSPYLSTWLHSRIIWQAIQTFKWVSANTFRSRNSTEWNIIYRELLYPGNDFVILMLAGCSWVEKYITQIHINITIHFTDLNKQPYHNILHQPLWDCHSCFDHSREFLQYTKSEKMYNC